MVASLVITRTQMRFYLAARRVVNVFPLRPLGSVRVPRVAFGVASKNKLSTGSDLSRLARTERSATRESFRSRQHATQARLIGSESAWPWRRTRARPRRSVRSLSGVWSGCRCRSHSRGWRRRRLSWCSCRRRRRRRWLVSEGTGEFRRTPNAALKSASGDVHDVETLHDR
jgi:hypothetical protein